MLGPRLMVLLAAGVPAFGGEDPLAPAPDGDNWHHEGLSRRAAQRAGWSAEAENALAFHTDYVDSYLYSPLWWLPPPDGGIDRLRVVMSSKADLVRVHFDDLFAPEQVHAIWRRYLSGTVCGLLWVARQDLLADVKASMAHNVVGVSLHAIQDFWTHSNWIDDPVRRPYTWFETEPATRAGYSLWTGSYEVPDHLGIKPHGKYQFACAGSSGGGATGGAIGQVKDFLNTPGLGQARGRGRDHRRDADRRRRRWGQAERPGQGSPGRGVVVVIGGRPTQPGRKEPEGGPGKGQAGAGGQGEDPEGEGREGGEGRRRCQVLPA